VVLYAFDEALPATCSSLVHAALAVTTEVIKQSAVVLRVEPGAQQGRLVGMRFAAARAVAHHETARAGQW
jgi:hypothetical protein